LGAFESTQNFDGPDGTRCTIAPLTAERATARRGYREVNMVDGFHWTRVTSKQLRFLYEEVTTLPPPRRMRDLAAAIDGDLDAVARSRQRNASQKTAEAQPACAQ
jgi:hypothetical protein